MPLRWSHAGPLPHPSGPAAPESLRPMACGLWRTTLALCSLTGCSTVADVQQVPPSSGTKASYAATLPEIQGAAVRALAANRLGVKSVTREGDTVWVVIASRGVGEGSNGEIVRIRAVRLNPLTTDVWIHSQRRIATNVTAKDDWAETLLADIRDEVKAAQPSAPTDWIVLHQGLLTILDVTISPGDTTPFHTHDAAVMYVPIMLSTTESQVAEGAWGHDGPEIASRLRVGAASSDLLYANRPLTHRVANIGPGEFRVLEIVNGSSRGDDTPTAAIPGQRQANSVWFDQSILVLDAGKRTRWFSAEMPVVVVVPESGTVTVERVAASIAYDPPPSVSVAAGGWTLIPAGARYRVQNDGTGPSTALVVQVRQMSPPTGGSR